MDRATVRALRIGDRVRWADGTLGTVREINMTTRLGYLGIEWSDEPGVVKGIAAKDAQPYLHAVT